MSAALRRGGRHGLGFRVIRTDVCRSCRHRGQGAIFKPAGQASDVKRELSRALPRGQPQVAPLVPLALGARPLDEAAAARDREQADDGVVAAQLHVLEARRTRLGVELDQLRPHDLGAGTHGMRLGSATREVGQFKVGQTLKVLEEAQRTLRDLRVTPLTPPLLPVDFRRATTLPCIRVPRPVTCRVPSVPGSAGWVSISAEMTLVSWGKWTGAVQSYILPSPSN